MCVCVCVCVCVLHVWADGEDEIMGLHSATGGRRRLEHTESARRSEMLR